MKSGLKKQPLFFFIFLVVIIIIVPYNNSTSTSTTTNPNPKFIKTSCTSTTYPKLCFTTLSPHANKIQTNSELLTQIAIDVALSSTETTSGIVQTLLRGGRLTRREVGAVTDCAEELRDSIEEMKKSMGEMKKLKGGDYKFYNIDIDFEIIMSNIETWVSAALTDEDSCMEGFGDMDDHDHVKVFVRQHVLNIAHLTSNALALVNRFAHLHA